MRVELFNTNGSRKRKKGNRDLLKAIGEDIFSKFYQGKTSELLDSCNKTNNVLCATFTDVDVSFDFYEPWKGDLKIAQSGMNASSFRVPVSPIREKSGIISGYKIRDSKEAWNDCSISKASEKMREKKKTYSDISSIAKDLFSERYFRYIRNTKDLEFFDSETFPALKDTTIQRRGLIAGTKGNSKEFDAIVTGLCLYGKGENPDTIDQRPSLEECCYIEQYSEISDKLGVPLLVWLPDREYSLSASIEEKEKLSRLSERLEKMIQKYNKETVVLKTTDDKICKNIDAALSDSDLCKRIENEDLNLFGKNNLSQNDILGNKVTAFSYIYPIIFEGFKNPLIVEDYDQSNSVKLAENMLGKQKVSYIATIPLPSLSCTKKNYKNQYRMYNSDVESKIFLKGDYKLNIRNSNNGIYRILYNFPSVDDGFLKREYNKEECKNNLEETVENWVRYL